MIRNSICINFSVILIFLSSSFIIYFTPFSSFFILHKLNILNFHRKKIFLYIISRKPKQFNRRANVCLFPRNFPIHFTGKSTVRPAHSLCKLCLATIFFHYFRKIQKIAHDFGKIGLFYAKNFPNSRHKKPEKRNFQKKQTAIQPIRQKTTEEICYNKKRPPLHAVFFQTAANSSAHQDMSLKKR